jgi:hypothetical protein
VTTFVVGVIVGASLAALLIIVIAPSRRVRSEPEMRDEDVTRLLLGEDPDDADDEDEISLVAEADAEHHRSYDAKELQALRNIGQPRAGSRRRR